MTPRISVAINTLNEERHLPYALRSVLPWADEVLVVDDGSTDRTLAIASAHGAIVHHHDSIGVVEGSRDFAIGKATGDWILLLDADEVVPAELSRRLRAIAAADEADVVVIPWLNYFLGSPLRGTGYGPEQDKHPRFFKRGALETSSRVHMGLRPRAGARVLELDPAEGLVVHHFSHLDSTQFLDKLNRYTSAEARQAVERGERRSIPSVLARALWWFMHKFVRGRGYRDGWRGFYISAYMAFYQLAIGAKMREIESWGMRDAVDERYRAAAEEVIAGHARERSASPEASLTTRGGPPPPQHPGTEESAESRAPGGLR